MAVTDGKIQFEDADANQIEVDLPLYPYKTTIDLPFEIQKLENGTYTNYDHAGGVADDYDSRSCQCTLELTAAEAATFNDWFSEDNEAVAKARGHNITLRMNADSGFFPFGPDKGDKGDFTVALIIRKQDVVGEAPYLYFHIDVDMVNVGAWPTYSAPSEVSEGSFAFGTVTNCRFPPEWFKHRGEYRVYRTTEQDGTVQWIDRGDDGDWHETGFEMHANESKAAKIIAYLVDTARTASFQVVTAANFYMFGRDVGGNGTYNVQLIQDKIVITHRKHNHFTYPLNLAYVSTA